MAKKWPNYGYFEPKTANVMAQKKHFHQSQLACGLWSAFEPIWSPGSTKNRQLAHSLTRPFKDPGPFVPNQPQCKIQHSGNKLLQGGWMLQGERTFEWQNMLVFSCSRVFEIIYNQSTLFLYANFLMKWLVSYNLSSLESNYSGCWNTN